MRLQPLLRTVLWAALLSSPLRGGCGLRHEVYWNSSNPRLLRGDAVVELGLKDYLDIFCPHYEGPGPPEGPETFALYMVDWPGYEACRAEGPGAFKRWECSLPFAPFGPVRFSEKIQRFTPFSLGFEFLPGETYYYICDSANSGESWPVLEAPGVCLLQGGQNQSPPKAPRRRAPAPYLSWEGQARQTRWNSDGGGRLGFDEIGSLSLLGAKAEDLGTGRQRWQGYDPPQD
ncbi:hypothetical protein EI555_001894 [Monodon monoceros]|uniref:Ephrin-A4 n=1 Tax=Monodon monoceros TaxID=40151 RepID=A0A4U1ERS1_MONMO|nr:hypothetical protein EI555_001894 [Monodon monoceros]